MVALSGRTKMSSRGQVVIPKALREAAGINEGDELEVVFDGGKLILAPYSRPERARETGLDYIVARAAAAHRLEDGLPPSRIWADRMRAVAALKKLRAELPPMSEAELKEILAQSRRELEERAPGGRRD